MFDKPIRSIDDAKYYFKQMGCSHFHMAREYTDRYKEYKLLNISKQTEIEWKLEQLDEYYKRIMVENDDNLWIVHSSMDDLVETLKNEYALGKILEVTRFIREKVPLNDRVIVSETINGRSDRKYRSGLIYLSYDLKNISAAKEFAELSLHYATYIENKTREKERCCRATYLCNAITEELKLR